MAQVDPGAEKPAHSERRRTVWPAACIAAVSALGLLWTTGWLGPGRSSLRSAGDAVAPNNSEEPPFMANINKSDDEWRAQLTPEQFEVTRRAGTEQPFSGQYWNHKEQGQYKCICCGAELFTSATKYDSGCGWPSFYASSKPENLHTLEDRKYGMARTEVRCQNCGAHLGHVFDDGPQPTGERYCMNSAAMKFEKKPTAEKPKE